MTLRRTGEDSFRERQAGLDEMIRLQGPQELMKEWIEDLNRQRKEIEAAGEFDAPPLYDIGMEIRKEERSNLMAALPAKEEFVPGREYTLDEIIRLQGPKPPIAERIKRLEALRKKAEEQGDFDDNPPLSEVVMEIRRQARSEERER